MLPLRNILSQVLSGEWRCSWSSADRLCFNYIGVVNNLIVYLKYGLYYRLDGKYTWALTYTYNDHLSIQAYVDHSDVVEANEDKCVPRRETFKFWALERLVLEILW